MKRKNLVWLGIGLALGGGLGVVLHNIPVGAACGLAFGLLIAVLKTRREQT